MYCSECGQRAHGKFCSHCGASLSAEQRELPLTELVPDWDREVQYEAILRFPGVREKIERHARQAPKRLSGEKFLQIADKVLPTPVPLEGLAAVVQPLYARLGIKTGKERIEAVSAPVGKAIVQTLCSLARNGQTVRSVTQANDGCLFEAVLPSDMFAMEGSLVVSVRRIGLQQAEVRGVTSIAGQLFDWGKSGRCLDQLFRDLEREAA
jgi:hypothetical protein